MTDNLERASNMLNGAVGRLRVEGYAAAEEFYPINPGNEKQIRGNVSRVLDEVPEEELSWFCKALKEMDEAVSNTDVWGELYKEADIDV